MEGIRNGYIFCRKWYKEGKGADSLRCARTAKLHVLCSTREKATRGVSPFLAWGDFHARLRFACSTISEEKWGTTRSLTFCGAVLLKVMDQKALVKRR